MPNSSLQVVRKGNNAEVVPLAPGLTIGRRPECGIQIEDAMISRTHAEILVEDGAFVLQDRSANGTLHNGKRLAPGDKVRLADQDRIGFAHYKDCEIVVRIAARAPVPEPDPAQSTAALPKVPQPQPLMQHLLAGGIPVWSKGKTRVVVADIIDEAPAVRTYRFVGQTPLMFSYKPGQFVTLLVEIDGKKVARSYSLSSTPSRPHVLEITVKRVPGGLVSNWLADNLKLGDTVEVGSPGGRFTCFDYPSDKMLFIGAGSGVTPLMSMTRWVIDTIADVDIRFLVSARTPDEIIFHRELEYLSARHSGFQCAVTVTSLKGGADPWLGYSGRLNRAMLELVAPDIRDRHVFLCGPQQFSDAVKDLLVAMQFPMENMHTESFTPGRVGPEAKAHESRPAAAPRPAAAAAAPPAAAAAPRVEPKATPAAAPVRPPSPPAPVAKPRSFKVRFSKSGVTLEALGDKSILDLAGDHGLDLEHQCRYGSCGVCAKRCISGKVEMENQDGLEMVSDIPREQAILTCMAMPRSDLEIDA